MRRLSDINESVWADIHRRSNDGSLRKEDTWFEEKFKVFAERHNLKEGDYHINNSDLSVDLYRNISISPEDLVDGKLPFKFGKIQGTMWLTKNLQLKTLENSPREVYGDFVIYENRFSDFIGGPELVTGDFSANFNMSLKSLDGSPKKVGGNYSICFCSGLQDIKGISKEIGGNLELSKNMKFTEDDFRKYSDIKGKVSIR